MAVLGGRPEGQSAAPATKESTAPSVRNGFVLKRIIYKPNAGKERSVVQRSSVLSVHCMAGVRARASFSRLAHFQPKPANTLRTSIRKLFSSTASNFQN